MMPFAAVRLRNRTGGGGGPVYTWFPNTATGLRGWWIADNGANSIVGGFLAAVADNSGNSNVLNPFGSGSGNYATLVSAAPNGRTVWRGDAVSRRAAWTAADGSVTQDAAGVTMAFVHSTNPAAGSADQTIIKAPISGVSSARSMIGRGSYAPNAVYAGGRRLDSDSYDGANDNTDYGTSWLVIVAVLDYANATLDLSVNGTVTTDAAFQTPGNTTNLATALYVGHNGSNAGNAFGDYAEGVIYKAALGTSDRQKLEGYLAWKWGLEGALPPGHPYKAAPA